ncbi:unnamed protein product [Gadus morhua 'NCC']
MVVATATAAAAAFGMVWLLVQGLAASGQSSACWERTGPGVAWNHSCPGPDPYVMFLHGEALHRMDLDGGNHRRVVSGVGRVVSDGGRGGTGPGLGVLLDYHYTQRSLFWAERSTGVLYRAGLSGPPRQKLVSSQRGVSGLAVDWLEDRVYWTNEEHRDAPTNEATGDIRSVSLTGGNQEMVVSGLERPCCLVLDPRQRVLFWLSGGPVSSIQRADLSGRTPAALIAVRGQLTALTLDLADRRLFWARFGSNLQGAICSCDYDGENVTIMNPPLRSSSVCLSVFLDEVFYSDSASHSIQRINKYSGVPLTDVNLQPMSRAPVGLRVVHPLNQPIGGGMPLTPGCDDRIGECVDVCSSSQPGVCQCGEGFTLSYHGNYCEDVNECALWNHGCSLGCENLPGSYACSCPEGYALLADRKSCHEVRMCVGELRGCGLGCLDTEAGPMCVCPEGSVLMDNGRQCTDSSDQFPGKNTTLNDEGPLSAEEEEDQEKTFTEKMVADQEGCGSPGCHVHARCAQEEGRLACRCVHGFQGDGRLCVDIDECSSGTPPCDRSAECHNSPGSYLCRCRLGYHGDGTTCEDTRTTVSMVTASPTPSLPRRHGDSLGGCPASHASFCLYEGTCRYLAEMEAFACNCVAGYMGERCQFNDLQWWELQEAKQEKRKSVAIVACMLLLISLLFITATAIYCYRRKRFLHKQPSVEDLSETSVTDDSSSEAASGLPRVCVILGGGEGGEVDADPSQVVSVAMETRAGAQTLNLILLDDPGPPTPVPPLTPVPPQP